MCNAKGHVRSTPESGHVQCNSACPLCANSGHRRLFDHLVGDLLEMHRHVEAQRLGGLEIDDELIFRRRLHWHVGWFLALEDAVDVAGRAPVQVNPIRPIGEQAAGGDEGAIEVDCGELVPRRKRDDQTAINKTRPAGGHDQSTIWGSREGRDDALDLAGVALVERADLHPERRRHGLNDTELGGAGGCVGIPQDRHSLHAGRDLLEQLQPFSADAVFEKHETGGVAARVRKAVDEPAGDWIGDDREHDWHGARRLQQRPYGRGARCQNDIRRKCGQLCRVFANSGDIGRGPADVNAYVAAIDPTQFLQRLPERTDPGLIVRIVRGVRPGVRRYAEARPAAHAPRAAMPLPPHREAR